MCLGLDTERACLSLCGASTSFPLVKLVKISLAELDHFQHGSRWCYIVVTCVLKLREEFHMHCFVYLDSFPSLIKSYLADKIIEVSWLSWLIRHISIRNGRSLPVVFLPLSVSTASTSFLMLIKIKLCPGLNYYWRFTRKTDFLRIKNCTQINSSSAASWPYKSHTAD